MPNNQSRQDNAFAQFDAMSTEELQRILREDASNTEGEGSDMETILYVMEVLAKRRKEQNEGKSPEEALESFKSKYYIPNDDSFISERETKGQKRHIQIWLSRGLIAAITVLVLIIGSSFTAHAMGFDLFEVIAKWTQETFHFGLVEQAGNPIDPSPDFVNPCVSLQEALDGYKIASNVVPTWLPAGYVEVDIKKEETPIQRRFFAIYQADENTIRIRIVDYLSGTPTQIEQSDNLVEIYSCKGIDYYIFNNLDQLRATWIVDNLECFIMGSLTVSEMKDIIDSIE